jgi:8-oxo-dGTP diphosphatase
MNQFIKSRATQSEDLQYYFRAACSVTCVIFGFQDQRIKVLLVKRSRDPFKNSNALPSDMVYPNDSIEQKVDELISFHTGTTNFYKKQIRAFAETSRHPLGRVISIGYYCFVNSLECHLNHSTNQEVAGWMDLKMVPQLAFDHNEIVGAAHRRLLAKMSNQLAGFELLPRKFTLKQFQEVYEACLGHELDKRNFRRKIISQEVILETGEFQNPWEESGKAPMLYTLNRKNYDQLKLEGNKFEIF